MHETRDIHPLGVSLAGAGLGLFLILVALMPLALVPAVGSLHDRMQPRVQTFQLPPEPRLQRDSIDDLARIRSAELARLNSSGPDHIPIEQAMAIVAQRGVPVRAAGVPTLPPPTPVPDIATNPPWGRGVR